MQNKTRMWMNKKTVLFQMIVLVSLLILPIYMVVFGYTILTRASYMERGKDNIRNVLESYMKTLDDRIISADEYTAWETNTNKDAVQLQNARNEEQVGLTRYFFWQTLDSRIKNSIDADAYFFYQKAIEKGELAMKREWSSKRAVLQENLNEMAEADKEYKWKIRDISGEKWLIHFMKEGKWLLFGSMINLSSIEEKIQVQLEGEGVENIVFTMEEQVKSGDKIWTLSERTDCVLSAEIDSSRFMLHVPTVTKLAGILTFSYILLIPVLLYIVYVKMILPTRTINEAMRKLEENNQDYRIPQQGESKEATQMFERFNAMANRLKNLKIQVYEEELRKREMEAVNLRLQVNPHFILNCLNTIYSLAGIGNAENTRRFTKSLANYLRFTLWHTDGTVRLADEMKGVEDYLKLQEIRYPGRFTYLSNIEDDVKKEQIPSLLIINFVENAVKHGLTMENEVEIIIIAKVLENRIRITVCDTGNGIDAKVLAHLQKGEIVENETGKHIGLWNCRRRLELMYRDACDFHITSRPGEGTQVFVEIPKEVRNESFDC